MSRPGIFGRIIQNIRNSNRIRNHEKTMPNVLVGTDQKGNKYFQKDASADGTIKRKRWAEPPDGDIAFLERVPMHWDQWLRGRHENAPTIEQEALIERRTKFGRQVDEKAAEDLKTRTELDEDLDPNKKRPFPTYGGYSGFGDKKPD